MKHYPHLYIDIKNPMLLSNRARDGSYLAELLLGKAYIVHGIIPARRFSLAGGRRASTFNTKRIDHLYKDLHNKNVKMFLTKHKKNAMYISQGIFPVISIIINNLSTLCYDRQVSGLENEIWI